MNTRLCISSASKETGEVLQRYLKDRGVEINRSSGTVICYGGPAIGDRVLNGNCGMDKITRMVRMNEARVKTIPWTTAERWKESSLTFPLLARRTYGYGGTDIVPVFQQEEIPWRIAAGWEWFSEYVPVGTEYRVWVFRRTVLGCYEKVMRRPEEFQYIGRNFRNGFEFESKHSCSEGLGSLACGAVEAIGLDFGAVDVLEGMDGQQYVLEVNTAPGVIRSHAEPTLALLADEMVEWLREGE